MPSSGTSAGEVVTIGAGQTTGITLNAKKGDIICVFYYAPYPSFPVSGDVTQIYNAGSQPNWYSGFRANSDTTFKLSYSDVANLYWSQTR